MICTTEAPWLQHHRMLVVTEVEAALTEELGREQQKPTKSAGACHSCSSCALFLPILNFGKINNWLVVKTCVFFHLHFIGLPSFFDIFCHLGHWIAWGQPAKLIPLEVMKREPAHVKAWSYLLPFFPSTTTTGCLAWAMMESMGYAGYAIVPAQKSLVIYISDPIDR